jgi:hypothetical protein
MGDNPRIRGHNTMKLAKNRTRPELPEWYGRAESQSYIDVGSCNLGRESDFWEEVKWLDSDRGRANRTQNDKVNVAEAVASRLKLKNHEIEEIRRRARNLNAQEVGCYGGIRALALGVIAYVVNKRREERGNFKLEDRIQNEEEFIQLSENIGVSEDELCETSKKVNQMINRG